MRKSLYGILIITSIIFYGCSAAARFTGNKTAAPVQSGYKEITRSDTTAHEIEPETDGVLEVETGIASYYADEFDGKPTASGVIYNMNGISAAHPFHPLGTIARVTNLVNNRSVVLEINDRMPYREDRIIDLSLGAAKELDMLVEGIQKVKIEVLKWGTGKKIDRIRNPF